MSNPREEERIPKGSISSWVTNRLNQDWKRKMSDGINKNWDIND